MASGDFLIGWGPLSNEPPASAFATLDTIDSRPIAVFNDTTDSSVILSAPMPSNYGAATGVTLTLIWAGATATTGNCVWNAAFERNEATFSIAASAFASAQAATAAAPGTANTLAYTTIAFTAGAQMDSVVAGDWFRLQITRDANNGSDTMTGNATLVGVMIHET